VEFANSVQKVFARISENPDRHPPVYREIRRAIVRPFPYAIFYRIRDERVVVLAVFHNKRDAKIWQSRS